MRNDLGLHIEILQRFDCQQRLGDTAFHIVNPGSPHGVALLFERHFLKGAQRPDSIVMTQDQLRRRTIPCTGGPGVQHAAAAAARNSPDQVAQPFELAGDDFPYVYLSIWDVRGRFRLRHAIQQANHRLAAIPEMRQHLFGCRMHVLVHGPDYFFMPAGNGKELVWLIDANRPGCR